MATKKQLINRWLEEPGRTIAGRIRQMLIDYAELLIPLSWKAREVTGLYHIPKEWLPPFDTKSIFDLLERLPFRDEIANGRDLRGVPSIGGSESWDFSDTDFSFLPGEEGHSFQGNLDHAIFDGSKGEFEFRGSLKGASFKRVRFSRNLSFWRDCFECDFLGAFMKSASFSDYADLRGCCFYQANLTEARLIRCDLRGCDFRYANLSGAHIHEAVIDKSTDFRGANLVEMSWQDRRDNSGNLFLRASDWRQGTYDSTTIHD